MARKIALTPASIDALQKGLLADLLTPGLAIEVLGSGKKRTHLGNLYVEADGTPGFFDSVPCRWSPLGEVANHIGCALDQVDRRDHERALIGAYLGELARSGVSPPTLDEAMRTYAAFLSFGFCIFMVNAAKWQPEAINTAYTARFSAAMIDNDTLGALEELG
jgi:hypothetical protein